MKASRPIMGFQSPHELMRQYDISQHAGVEFLFSEYIRSLPLARHRHERAELQASCRLIESSEIENIEPLGHSGRSIPIAAVDASSNLVGYSGGFAYELLRVAIVVRDVDGKIKVVKLGPLIMKSSFERGSFLHELECMAISIAASKVKDGIVLLDGTTSEVQESGTAPSPSQGNNFISLSKAVPLQLPRLSDSLPEYPFLAKLRTKNTFLVRLSPKGFVLNAMTSTRHTKSARALFNCLIRSDVLEIGYPRTMKLAHIYSKILPMDVISARLALFERHNIKARNPIDGRKLLLGCLWG